MMFQLSTSSWVRYSDKQDLSQKVFKILAQNCFTVVYSWIFCGDEVVSIGHFPAFYVVLLPLEYIPNILHSFSFVKTYFYDGLSCDIICILTSNTNTKYKYKTNPVTLRHNFLLCAVRKEELYNAALLNFSKSTKIKLWRKLNGEVYLEYTPLGTKQHKKQENDQWRLLTIQAK